MPTNKPVEDALNEWARNWRKQQEEMSYQPQYRTQNQTPYYASAPNRQQTPYPAQSRPFATQSAVQSAPQPAPQETSVLSPEDAQMMFQKGVASKTPGFFSKNRAMQTLANVGDTALKTALPLSYGVSKWGSEVAQGLRDYRAYNPHTNVPNVISPNQTYIQNVTNLAKEAKRVGVMNLGDNKKHQYVSCFGASNGMPYTVGTAGVLKEVWDFVRKNMDPKLKEKYGGKNGIIADGVSDLISDAYGLYLGYTGDDCSRILKER